MEKVSSSQSRMSWSILFINKEYSCGRASSENDLDWKGISVVLKNMKKDEIFAKLISLDLS